MQQSPYGVLYHEIDNPVGFAEQLSKEIELKTAPFLIWRLDYISDRYTHYVELPQCELKALKTVFDILEDVSVKYKKKMGQVPVLVIDGVDLLAKHNEELCCQLITNAKIFANRKTLNVVLVSSEGSVVPLLNKLSATNRSVICEIGDIGTVDAHAFLMQNGVDATLAKK